MKTVKINNIEISNDLPFCLIAGPDSLESMDHALMMAHYISSICQQYNISYIFKASYDKANRTSVNSWRGVGLEEGLKIFKKIKDLLGVSVTTDIHSPAEAEAVKDVIDLIQIPALLSRQTDLLIAAGKTGKAINIKKGQFISPNNADMPIKKVASTGNESILITERGYTFGYNDIVADMRSLVTLKKYAYPVIFDASHTAQLPSSNGDKSGGNREMIANLARSAVAVGVAGIFMEIHNDPDNAPVDGMSSLKLTDLPHLLNQLSQIDRIIK